MKKILNKLLLIIACVFLIGNASFVSAREPNTRNVALILFDEENKKISYTVKTLNQSSGSAVTKALAYYNKDKKGDKKDNTVGESSEITLINYIWPSIWIDEGGLITASNADNTQASSVVGEVITDFNTAIAYVLSNTDETDFEEVARKLAYKEAIYKITYSIDTDLTRTNNNKETFKQGAVSINYLKITADGADPIVVMISCPNGYGSGEYLSDSPSTKIEGITPATFDFSWKMVYEAANQAKKNGLTADNGGFEDFTTMGDVEEKMKEMANNQTLDIQVLGFFGLESLVFNRGSRGYTYYLGMMPLSWFQASNVVFWVCEIIGVLILLFSIANLIFKQNMAIVSPIVRVNIQDQIANIIIAIFLMVLYVPIFYIIAKINSMIIAFLNSVVGGMTLTTSFNISWLANLIVLLIVLFIMVKLNIEYLTRAVMLTLMHGMAPAAIASIALQQKRDFFNKWLHEFISAIFLQTFDALLLTIFIMVAKNGVFSFWWEPLLMTYMFIPLNKWFKQTFGSGSVSQVGDATAQGGKAMASIAGGAVGAGIAQGVENKAIKNTVDKQTTNQINGNSQSHSSKENKNGEDSGSANSSETKDTIETQENNQNNSMERGSISGQEQISSPKGEKTTDEKKEQITAVANNKGETVLEHRSVIGAMGRNLAGQLGAAIIGKDNVEKISKINAYNRNLKKPKEEIIKAGANFSSLSNNVSSNQSKTNENKTQQAQQQKDQNYDRNVKDNHLDSELKAQEEERTEQEQYELLEQEQLNSNDNEYTEPQNEEYTESIPEGSNSSDENNPDSNNSE